jgi:type IV fimbrial biogenesis protein FimT
MHSTASTAKTPTTRTLAARQRGVTLVEMAIVFAIVSLLFAVGMPSFEGFKRRHQLENLSSQLMADLQYLRSEAAARNEPVRISFSRLATGTCYVIHTGAAQACRCTSTTPGTPASCEASAHEIRTVFVPAADHIGVQANVASMLVDPRHGTVSPTGTVRVVADAGSSIDHVVNIMGRVRTCSRGGATALRAC